MTEAERELLILIAEELRSLVGFVWQDNTRGRPLYLAIEKLKAEDATKT